MAVSPVPGHWARLMGLGRRRGQSRVYWWVWGIWDKCWVSGWNWGTWDRVSKVGVCVTLDPAVLLCCIILGETAQGRNPATGRGGAPSCFLFPVPVLRRSTEELTNHRSGRSSQRGFEKECYCSQASPCRFETCTETLLQFTTAFVLFTN